MTTDAPPAGASPTVARATAPTAARRSARLAACAAALLAAATAVPADAGAERLEAEFRRAIERLEGATVVVVPRAGGRRQIGTSGVLVTRSGLVFTSSDAGRLFGVSDGRGRDQQTDDVEVRVPDRVTGTFTNFRGRVVARSPDLSAAVVRVADPPKAGFSSYLVPGTSAHLEVGSFTFAMGNSFGLAAESAPTLTAGVVAARTPLAGGGTGGEHVYTTAAVNPGVSGGPLVDAQGRLVGIVAGWVDASAEPESPFQFLGRAIPMDRLRAAWADSEEAKEAFAASPPPAAAAEESRALETVFARVAAQGHPSVASLVVERSTPISGAALGGDGSTIELPRYRGPVSAVVASEDGLLVTALHDLTNVATIVTPAAASALPPEATARAGLAAVGKVTACFSDGTTAPARIVGIHEPLGIAVLRADLPSIRRLHVTEPCPEADLSEGRFVVALGNPYGTAASRSPLVTFGILSRRHPDDAGVPWRGHWQTDARATDANCGGAVLDLRGRLVGMLTMWDVARHGRASGIAFVLPWAKVRAVLPDLAAGRSFRRPFLGVQWAPGGEGARIQSVIEGTAAAACGLREGDVLVEIDGTKVATIGDCVRALSSRWAGDRVRIRVRRGGETVDVEAVLGIRD